MRPERPGGNIHPPISIKIAERRALSPEVLAELLRAESGIVGSAAGAVMATGATAQAEGWKELMAGKVADLG